MTLRKFPRDFDALRYETLHEGEEEGELLEDPAYPEELVIEDIDNPPNALAKEWVADVMENVEWETEEDVRESMRSASWNWVDGPQVVAESTQESLEGLRDAQEHLDKMQSETVPQPPPPPPSNESLANDFKERLKSTPWKTWYNPAEDEVLTMEADEERGEFLWGTDATIANHTVDEHVGHFYTASTSEDLYQSHGATSWQELTNSRSVLLREPMLRVAELVDDDHSTWVQHGTLGADPAQRGYLINGGRGHGKSMCLDYAVERALAKGWLVLYLPRGHQYTAFGLLTYRYGNTKSFTMPYEDTELMQSFARLNHALLAEMPVTLEASKEYKPEASNLAELLEVQEHQVGSVDTVSQGLYLALAEIEAQRKHPLLFAVDEWNGFFGRTDYEYSENGTTGFPKGIDTYELDLVRIIRDTMSGDMRRAPLAGAGHGAEERGWGMSTAKCLVAPSYSAPRKLSPAYSASKDTLKWTDVPLTMPEAERVMEYLYHQEFVGKRVPTEQIRLEWFTSDGNLKHIVDRLTMLYHMQPLSAEEKEHFIESRDFMLTQLQM
eukprot:TRINITY_DN2314_c0_g1_i1.p1 TRINITY_DN2314_c0_g1~~TRINITY_DN2314_c0_g1_i1.p1  ORF type:complete len:553 (+),score=124.05 TRINITY_DN2314_c0_g1_i1:859-2517(+)